MAFVNGWAQAMRRATGMGVLAAAQAFADTSRESMPGAGSQAFGSNFVGPLQPGRNQRSSDISGRLMYIPSTPGNPPGKRSGFLQDSVQAEMVSEFVARFGTNRKYARIHELGGTTPGGQPYIFVGPGQTVFVKKDNVSKYGKRVRYTRPGVMPARPFLRPAIAKGRELALSEFGRAFDRTFAASIGGAA